MLFLPLKRVFDRAIAGAAADIAFQRRAEILPLRLVERRAGQDHARGAEPALKAPARRGTPAASDACRLRAARPSMVVTAWPSARKAGIRQLCTGSPSISTVQAPQSPASQPFLTPKCPSSRRKVRRHCPARGVFRKRLAVDLEAHGRAALAVRREFLRQDAASCACAIAACRERRRGRGHRECDAGSPRAARRCLEFPEMTI